MKIGSLVPIFDLKWLDMSLSNTNFPEHLFRFRSDDSEFFVEEIKQALASKIFLSDASKLNDPFDCRPLYQSSSRPEIIRALNETGYFRTLDRKRHQELLGTPLSRAEHRARYSKSRHKKLIVPLEVAAQKKTLRELPKKTKIACFSAKKDNLPMWAHYANDHKGVRLNYELELDKADPRRVLVPFEVEYQVDRPQVTTADMLRFTCRNHEVRRTLNPAFVMDALYLRKSIDWAYEQEWRVFSTDNGVPRYVSLNHLKLSGVTLGLRATPQTVETVKILCSDKVKVTKLAELDESFGFREIAA